ncbi:MAG: sulfotransferase family protein [Vicinamibacterales bacterium]
MSGGLLRRLRYGAPIVVVSGLPRSGTSMMMRMLAAGGVAPLQDGIRTADVSNPNGYFEFEPVKGLDKDGDLAWLPAARGKAVKIISFLLTYLPERYDYRVVFMHRDLDEVLRSQAAMLEQRGEAAGGDAAQARELYTAHLAQVRRFMAGRDCFRTLEVDYGAAVKDPAAAAAAVAGFLPRTLDQAKMVAAVDEALYRNRR